MLLYDDGINKKSVEKQEKLHHATVVRDNVPGVYQL